MKLKKVIINSFRGIPNNLEVTFPNKGGKTSSLIILGDNGIGKSSIVDAIEFCLQGHVSQTESLKDKNIPSVLSYYKKATPSVNLVFQNDEIFERKIVEDEQGLLASLKGPNKYFAISPFVLRRHDILRFIDTADAERTLVFANYLRQTETKGWIDNPRDELKRLQDERLKSKVERDKLISELAKQLNISTEEIPFNRKEFYLFVNDKIYGGISKKQFEERGIKVKVNEKAVSLAERTLKEIENTRSLKNQINEYSISKKANAFPKHLLPQLNDFLVKVGEKLTDSFLEISPLNFIEKFVVEYDSKNVLALQLKIILANKRVCAPQQILSEANLDLLALLFFIAFIQESSERGQTRFLILDDVLQSIDATIRVNFISFLLRNLSDWQFLITAHDRLWHRQLAELMNLYGHSFATVSITNWTFADGPTVKTYNSDLGHNLDISMESGDLVNTCSLAGLILEEICDTLSMNFNTSIQRKKDDKYTIGDLWTGLAKQLKKSEIKEQIEEVETWLHLRNIIGAHFNEWALTLSLEEAKQFGKSVKKLLVSVKCEKCKSWLTTSPAFSFYSCKCGELRLTKK